MTDLRINVDTTEVLGLMSRISDNLPTARTWALNRTAEDVTAALRAEASARFTFRQPLSYKSVLGNYAPVKIPRVWRATDTKPYVSVVPEGPGKILRPFETGTPKVGQRGGPVVIPSKVVRPTMAATIPARFWPHNLWPQLRLGGTEGRTKKGKIKRTASWKQARPFLLGPKGADLSIGSTSATLPRNAWGIYQRVAPGPGGIRLLWAIRDSVRRPKLLNTYATAHRVAGERWAVNLTGAFRTIVRSPAGRASLLDLTV